MSLCAKRRSNGQPCKAQAVAGTDACRVHAGRPLAEQRARGAVVVELRNWGLTGHEELADPGQTLLKLVTQSAHRAELYASLLQQAYEAAERLRGLPGDVRTDDGALPPHEDNPTDRERAFRDLARVFEHGGVATLVGVKWGAAGANGELYAAEEAIRGLVRLESEERDRCANMAAKAVAAGLAERQVRLAERQAELVADAIRGSLTDLGHDLHDPAVMRVVSSRLLALSEVA